MDQDQPDKHMQEREAEAGSVVMHRSRSGDPKAPEASARRISNRTILSSASRRT